MQRLSVENSSCKAEVFLKEFSRSVTRSRPWSPQPAEGVCLSAQLFGHAATPRAGLKTQPKPSAQGLLQRFRSCSPRAVQHQPRTRPQTGPGVGICHRAPEGPWRPSMVKKLPRLCSACPHALQHSVPRREVTLRTGFISRVSLACLIRRRCTCACWIYEPSAVDWPLHRTAPIPTCHHPLLRRAPPAASLTCCRLLWVPSEL